MARRPTRIYSPEFKAEAVRLVLTSRDPLSQVARDVGVAKQTLHSWVQAVQPLAPVGAPSDPAAELVQLRREVQQLRMERDFLKKAAAFFAKLSE